MKVASVLLGLLAAANLNAAQQKPPDFAVKMFFGCPGHWIDTATGNYGHQIDATADATAQVRLTADELKEIAAAVDRIAFFDLPSQLRVNEWSDPGNGTLPTAVTITSPEMSVTIEVTKGGRRKSVELQNSSGKAAADSDAGRLQQLVDQILSNYRKRPEVQRLPQPRIFCL